MTFASNLTKSLGMAFFAGLLLSFLTTGQPRESFGYSVQSSRVGSAVAPFVIGLNAGAALPVGNYNSEITQTGLILSGKAGAQFNRWIGLYFTGGFATLNNDEAEFNRSVGVEGILLSSDITNDKHLFFMLGPSIGLHDQRFSIFLYPQVGIFKQLPFSISSELTDFQQRLLVEANSTQEAGLGFGVDLQTRFGINDWISLGLSAGYLQSTFDADIDFLIQDLNTQDRLEYSSQENVKVQLLTVQGGVFFNFGN